MSRSKKGELPVMFNKRPKPFFYIVFSVLLICSIGAVGFYQFIKKALPDMAGAMVASMTGLSAPSEGRIFSSYDPEPPPRDVDKDTVRAVIEQFRDSLFFLSVISPQKANVEMDRFVIPNGYYSDVDVQWNDSFDASGQRVFRPATAEEKAADERFQDPLWTWIYRTGTDRPVSATGTLHIKVPIRFAQIVLKTDQTGQPREADVMAGFSAELLQCENDVVSVKTTGNLKERQPIIIVCDETGGRLKTSGHMTWQTPTSFNSTFRAVGTVAEVRVFMPVAFVTETVEVTATAKPETHGPAAWTVRAARYAAEQEVPEFKEMDAAAVVQSTTVMPRRGYAWYGFNTPKIVVCLPRIDNSCFAHVTLSHLQLFDASGDTVAHKQSGGWFDFEGFFVRFDISDEEGDHENIVAFDRSIGTVNIRYPARLKTVTLTVDVPTAGSLEADFAGPKVTIRGIGDMRQRSLAPERYSHVRGYDGHGRRLKSLNHIPYAFSPNRNERLFGFWGTPAKVEIITVEKWVELELPFELAAAEKFPESQRGTKPLTY